jgi:hypothetical protein
LQNARFIIIQPKISLFKQALSAMSRIPRTALVNHVSDIGGAELSLLGLVQGMPRQHWQYQVVLSQPGPLMGRVAAAGVPLSLVRMESWRWWITATSDAVKFVLSFPLQLHSILRLWRYLRRGQFDVLHVNINWIIEPVLAARLAGVPCLVHFRNIPSRLEQRFAFGRHAYFWFMNKDTIWVANSTSIAREILPHRALKEFGSKQLPFKRFAANRAYYYLMVVSFFLFRTFKQDTLKDILPITSYATTIRRKLVDFAAKVVRIGGELILKVPAVVMERLQMGMLWTRCQEAWPILQV